MTWVTQALASQHSRRCTICTTVEEMREALTQLAALMLRTISASTTDVLLVRWLAVEAVLRLTPKLRLMVSVALLGELLAPVRQLTAHTDASLRLAAVAAMSRYAFKEWDKPISHTEILACPTP